MAVTDALVNASIFRPLAISQQVLEGQYQNVPTFAQLGLDNSINGNSIFGIAVSPQMDEQLRQEISMAFSNVTLDPTFVNITESLGAFVLTGYNYESTSLDTFINTMITFIQKVIDQPSPQPTNSDHQTNTLAIILGVIIPVFVILLIILILFTLYMRRKKTFLVNIDTDLDSMMISWDELADLKKIGSGSYVDFKNSDFDLH